MDLEALHTLDAHEDGAEVNIRDERGQKTRLWIRVRGMDSPVYRADQRRSRRALLEHLQRTRDGSVELDEFDEEARDTDTLVRMTISWRQEPTEDDSETEIPFSAERVKELYTKAPYIRDQVDRFIANRGNFTKG